MGVASGRGLVVAVALALLIALGVSFNACSTVYIYQVIIGSFLATGGARRVL